MTPWTCSPRWTCSTRRTSPGCLRRKAAPGTSTTRRATTSSTTAREEEAASLGSADSTVSAWEVDSEVALQAASLGTTVMRARPRSRGAAAPRCELQGREGEAHATQRTTSAERRPFLLSTPPPHETYLTPSPPLTQKTPKEAKNFSPAAQGFAPISCGRLLRPCDPRGRTHDRRPPHKHELNICYFEWLYSSVPFRPKSAQRSSLRNG